MWKGCQNASSQGGYNNIDNIDVYSWGELSENQVQNVFMQTLFYVYAGF